MCEPSGVYENPIRGSPARIPSHIHLLFSLSSVTTEGKHRRNVDRRALLWSGGGAKGGGGDIGWW